MPVPRLPALVFVLLLAILATAPVFAETRESSFIRPPGLAPAVAFWTLVYSDLDSASGVIHDDRQLDVIYQTLYLNPAAPPKAQTKTITKTIEDYRAALLALASGKRRGLTTVEQQALQPWGENATESELKGAAERLRFQRGQADRIQQGMVRAMRWNKHIKDVFQKRGLPTELAALPHVESSYNPDAVSKAGAAGLWQFMPATARRYLRVDAVVDERLDPYKSSEAAASLLQHNYSVLKSWPLAITAYNHGLSGVRRAVRETGTDDLDEIVRSYQSPSFGFASRNFYAAFLAAVDVSENPERFFGESLLDSLQPITLIMPAFLPAEVLVEAYGVDKTRLRELNPTLHHGVWNGEQLVSKDYALVLPGYLGLARAEKMLARLSQYFGFSSQLPYRYYEVRSGDTLSLIAERHDANTQMLRSMNQLSSTHEIYPGQVLRVPMGVIPEPLGAGAATMLAAQRTRGGFDAGGALAVNVPQLVAEAMGQTGGRAGHHSAPSGLSADSCREETSGMLAGLPIPAATESAMAASPIETQPALAADPADYSVADDGSIEIQINETLGHYAEWLDLSSDHLREINNLDDKQQLIVGRRLKLEFSHATEGRFEQARIAFHQSLQLQYFRRSRIVGVLEHAIIAGDNLWMLAIQQYRIPMWLLRQYNPDINVDSVLPIDSLIYIPVVAALPEPPGCVTKEVDGETDRDA